MHILLYCTLQSIQPDCIHQSVQTPGGDNSLSIVGHHQETGAWGDGCVWFTYVGKVAVGVVSVVGGCGQCGRWVWSVW